MPDQNLTTSDPICSAEAAVLGLDCAGGAELDLSAAPPIGADNAAQISAFGQILERFEQNTLTERDKGTAFELLVRDVLSQAQPWCERFEKVQTYAEWAKEHPEHTSSDARDTGIDLVATNCAEDENIFLANTPPQ